MGTGSRRVVWTLRARAGLEDALEFVAQESPQGAFRILDVALSTAKSLEQLAERGRIVPETRDDSIREVFVFSYRLIYRTTDDAVEIIGFIHGARDFERWAAELDT